MCLSGITNRWGLAPLTEIRVGYKVLQLWGSNLMTPFKWLEVTTGEWFEDTNRLINNNLQTDCLPCRHYPRGIHVYQDLVSAQALLGSNFCGYGKDKSYRIWRVQYTNIVASGHEKRDYGTVHIDHKNYTTDVCRKIKYVKEIKNPYTERLFDLMKRVMFRNAS
jgi:hypothetical protein